MYRGILKDSQKIVYGAYLYHPKVDKHFIIEPAKDINGNYIKQFTFHLVDKDTIGLGLKVWMKNKLGEKEFYEGDIINEGDNFPSIIRFGENELNGYGFYLEEVNMLDDEAKSRRHLIDAYTTFPDESDVIGQIWNYTINVEIVSTPDGEFVCRNKYEVAKVKKNLKRLHDSEDAISHTENWTIAKYDNGYATDISIEYFKEI